MFDLGVRHGTVVDGTCTEDTTSFTRGGCGMRRRLGRVRRDPRTNVAGRRHRAGRGFTGAAALCAVIVAAVAALGGGATPAASGPAVTLTWWSHFASAANNQKVLLNAAHRFEEKHPGVAVKITFYEKEQLILALRAAFAAGQSAPDVYYYDNDMSEFITAGYAADLSTGVNWSSEEPWAKEYFHRPGGGGKIGVWVLPIEKDTDELYYNKKMFADLGITVPSGSYELTEAAFTAAVQKCVTSGRSAFAVGVGDRPYPGTYLTNYLLLHKLGEADLRDLWGGGGRVTWNDPRVQEVLAYERKLVDMKAFPPSMSSMKLAESHIFFHTQQKACMMPVGSWYTSRAFEPPDKSGQPKEFYPILGMMNYPSLPGGTGNNLKFMQVDSGVAINPKSTHLDEAKALFDVIGSPETGEDYVSIAVAPTTLKINPAKITGAYADYWKLYNAVNANEKPAVLAWQVVMKPGMMDAYTQVINSAFPEGLISVADATAKLEDARKSGR
jgi:multiple sugar transport system substrate-binding protein